MNRLLIAVMGVTRNLMLWQRPDASMFMETVWKPQGIVNRLRIIKSRPFVMACRPLCGLDLHYAHLTCFTSCRIRKGYYGKLSNPLEIERVYLLSVRKGRRFARQKDILLKAFASIAENLLAN